ALVGSPIDPAVTLVSPRRLERIAWLGGLLLIALTTAFTTVRFFRPVPPTEMRLEITTPPTSDPISFAISPDGEQIVFAVERANHSQLWVRALNSLSARPLAGTEQGTYPFWSPDGRSLGFFADAKLKRIEIESGSLQVLADAPDTRGGAWGRNGTIIFA